MFVHKTGRELCVRFAHGNISGTRMLEIRHEPRDFEPRTYAPQSPDFFYFFFRFNKLVKKGLVHNSDFWQTSRKN